MSIRKFRKTPLTADDKTVSGYPVFSTPHEIADALKGTRPAYFEQSGGMVETRVYHRGLLSSGDRFPGPAIIEEADSTTICP